MSAPSKREALERLLGQGMVMVHLDGRRPGVRVPPSLRGDAQLRLNLSYRFASRDLSVGDEVVGCTLSFSGQPYYCELPVDAIFAVTSHVTGEALVWPESLAAALENPLAPRAPVSGVAPPGEHPGNETTEPALPARPHLRLVK
jgi:stringent starvation protein B